jgi:hypothetical protein
VDGRDKPGHDYSDTLPFGDNCANP